ncbi:MAG: hypothetical protein KBH78_01905 [Candidatus Hydrogenedentes bacterium]|nr:hypothetical protein [Candidatus Hydrogenedentota bacterium]
MSWFEVSVVVNAPGAFEPLRIVDGENRGARWVVVRHTDGDVQVRATDSGSALRLGWDELRLERDARDQWTCRAVSRARVTLWTLLTVCSTLLCMAVVFFTMSPEFFAPITGTVPLSPVLLMVILAMFVLAVDLLVMPLLARNMTRQAVATWLRLFSGDGGARHDV